MRLDERPTSQVLVAVQRRQGGGQGRSPAILDEREVMDQPPLRSDSANSQQNCSVSGNFSRHNSSTLAIPALDQVLLGMTLEVLPLGDVDLCHYAPTVQHKQPKKLASWQIAAFRVSFQVSNSRDMISQLASELFRNGKITVLSLP